MEKNQRRGLNGGPTDAHNETQIHSSYRFHSSVDGQLRIHASGGSQESPNNFFAFFVGPLWDIETMGLPPTRNNNWDYNKWSKHAQYADTVSLPATFPHFYWQSGADPNERHKAVEDQCFISQDLPSFNSLTENFFVFHPEYQKGIQCRFGERGVVAATHYDGGRNMIGMIHGAKRYILSPPNQCSKLGIFTSKQSSIFRHSLLNFGHILYLNHTTTTTKATPTTTTTENGGDGGRSSSSTTPNKSTMSKEETAWLERAGSSLAIETVLKAGEGKLFLFIFLVVRTRAFAVKNNLNT